MTEDPSHELATAEEWNRARHRETVLRSLLTQSSLSETDIQIASKQMGVGRAYFYRLFAAYKLCPRLQRYFPAPAVDRQACIYFPPIRNRLSTNASRTFTCRVCGHHSLH
jgi:hypothetical protein